ncbi:sugar transferase [Geobacillus stearothermophilus]|nr:sugar transferase [Geobacillus stearothermophilus]
MVQNKQQLGKEFNRWLKYVFDFVASILGILVLLPIFLIISFLIKLDSKGPVIFKQVRVGKDGKEFEIYKFRTMVVDAEKLGKQITVGRDPRITRVGYF